MSPKIIISHRGNISGKNPDFENNTEHIGNLIDKNPALYVEVDLWAYSMGRELYLHHDGKIEGNKTNDRFFAKYKRNLFVHCKNPAAAYYCRNFGLNYFAHDKDDFVVTSNGFVWYFPGKEKPGCNGIMLDFTENVRDLAGYAGICTDFPIRYRDIKI